MTFTIQTLKDEARRLRVTLENTGTVVTHSGSLELVAKQKGYRDWNTALASIGNRPSGPPVWIGQLVEGEYLGQKFMAEVIGVQSQLQPGRWRVTLDLSEAVDVVKFESFSAFRKRISANITADGRTVEKTSDGVPQLVLGLPV
ncbi:MAG: glyoxalase superfamily protein [Salaquimonas sp.]